VNARELFEVRLPALLRESPGRARAVAGVLLFELSGEGGGTWTVDLASPVPTVTPGALPTAACAIRASAADFHTMLSAPSEVLALYRDGRIQVSGDENLATRFHLLFR
jgi:hypothetical protein